MRPLGQFIGWSDEPSPVFARAMSKCFHVPQISRGQAYAILRGGALMMTLAMGIRQNLGLFQAPASKELGIAISDFALAISVQQVAWGLSQPLSWRALAGGDPAGQRSRGAIVGLRFLSTLTGIAFMSHRAGSFL